MYENNQFKLLPGGSTNCIKQILCRKKENRKKSQVPKQGIHQYLQ